MKPIILFVLIAVLGTSGWVMARHIGPVGSFHIEARSGSSQAFDFETPAYSSMVNPISDIRLGLYPAEVDHPVRGYSKVAALNGAQIAQPGLTVPVFDPRSYPPGTVFVDFADVGCSDFSGAAFTDIVEVFARFQPIVPGEVLLMQTGPGTLVKMYISLIDFTNPNGLGFTYEILECDEDKAGNFGNVPGKGINHAPGLQKPWNEKSQAAKNAGKKQ